MTLTLTCILCLAGAAPSVAPALGDARDGAMTLSLTSAPTSASATPPDLRLDDPGPASALAQHERGSQEDGGEGDSRGHGGHGAWMGTAMIVVMVVMMVGLGAVMMARGGFRAAPPSGPAAAALPAFAPAGFSAPGG